jgi:hypothetical protein
MNYPRNSVNRSERVVVSFDGRLVITNGSRTRPATALSLVLLGLPRRRIVRDSD